MDATENEEGGSKKIASSRLMRVVDWRVMKTHWLVALKDRKLRPNDLQFIYSLLIAFIFWIPMTIIQIVYAPDPVTGIVYSVPFCYITVCVLIASAVIY
jgi:hypothetical protein